MPQYIQIKINITNAICDDDELEKNPAEINHFDQVNSIRGGDGLCRIIAI